MKMTANLTNMKREPASRRAQRAIARVARDRGAQVAAGAAAGAVGATAATTKALLERRRSRSQTYRFQQREDLRKGVRRVARGRADSAIAHLRGELDKEFAEAIHEARKDLKKLRSVVRLVRGPLGEDSYRRENERFRDAGRLLSGTRDAEVKLETLVVLRERFGDDFPEAKATPLVKALEGEREAISRRASAEDGGGGVAGAVRRIEGGRDAIGDWNLEGGGFELIEEGLRRSYRRGRNRFTETTENPSPETVHEWRKRVKDLWYHLRLVRDARPGKLGKAADRAHDLSDMLGDHHDLTVLREDAAERRGLLEDEARATLEELIARRQGELVDEATSLAEKVYARKPKKFVSRIGGYWDAWR
jgi:CHAD domain-containing protein